VAAYQQPVQQPARERQPAALVVDSAALVVDSAALVVDWAALVVDWAALVASQAWPAESDRSVADPCSGLHRNR
jgi:hypothetical protein